MVTGKIKKGKVVLDKPIDLPDGTRIRVEVIDAKKETDPFLWLIANAVPFGESDAAAEHDHYIYGSPKRSEEKRK